MPSFLTSSPVLDGQVTATPDKLIAEAAPQGGAIEGAHQVQGCSHLPPMEFDSLTPNLAL